MAGAIEIGGDIVAAGSAIAGLMLVYMGALSTSYSSYQGKEQGTVRRSFRMRMWFAFFGLVLSILSVAAALAGKLLGAPGAVMVALWLLLLGLAWVVAASVLTALEIK